MRFRSYLVPSRSRQIVVRTRSRKRMCTRWWFLAVFDQAVGSKRIQIRSRCSQDSGADGACWIGNAPRMSCTKKRHLALAIFRGLWDSEPCPLWRSRRSSIEHRPEYPLCGSVAIVEFSINRSCPKCGKADIKPASSRPQHNLMDPTRQHPPISMLHSYECECGHAFAEATPYIPDMPGSDGPSTST